MVRLGEESSAPLYFRSEERRPGGYTYYNRLYHSDGSQLEPAVQEHIAQSSNVYPSNHILNQARDQFRGEPDVNQYYHFEEQHSEKEYQESSDPSPYYSGQGQHSEREYQESSSDPSPYYSRQSQANHQTYDKSVPRYQDTSNDHHIDEHIEYSDLDLADEYEPDYGMEIEFEEELNRIEQGDGLIYEETGVDFVSRDNAQVYVSNQFINGNAPSEKNLEFDYDIGFYNY